MPLLSIIIPVYNTELYLQKCLDSILTQSYNDFELLLVDDGSKDKSGVICDEYAKRDIRVHVFHKENRGVSSARNMGIEKSKGEWLYFVDSDDILNPNTLSAIIDQDLCQYDLVMAGYNVYSEDGSMQFESKTLIQKEMSKEQALMEMYTPTDCPYQGYLWCKFFRGSVIKQNRLLFDENIYFNEDRLFIVKYIAACTRNIFYSTIPIYKYFTRESGAMASLRKTYNPKFVTDFDAFVLMKKIIFNISTDNLLRKAALRGICDSYTMNHNLMVKYDKYIPSLHRHMLKELILSGAIRVYVNQYVRPFLLLLWPSYLIKK